MHHRFQTNPFYKNRTIKYISILLFIYLHALNAQVGINIINNGQFDSGQSNWNLTHSGKGSATISASSDSMLSGANSLMINITAGGDSLSNVRVHQNFNMESGRYYNVSFMAVANRSCNIQTVFNTTSSSETTIWRGPVMAVTATPQHFGPFSYRSQFADNGRAVSFCMGGTDSVIVWLDSVVVEKTDDPENTRPEETLVASFTDTLNQLINNSNNDFLKLHFNSIIKVINNPYNLLQYKYATLTGMFNSFKDTTDSLSPRKLSSYLSRKRPFIIAWTSPTDGLVSFAQVLTPKNWDPKQIYPLYVALHGLWNVADNPIDYMTVYLSPDSLIHEPYDDGYEILPWGRGNLWYQGISETNIWECINTIESIVKVDQKRKYLTGHSMGGYGAWRIGEKSVGTWAALGIHAGALWWNNYELVSDEVVQKLKTTPVFFIVGDQDGLFGVNQQAYQMLQNAGDKNVAFETFSGGHVYLYENLKRINAWLKNFSLDNQSGVGAVINDLPTKYKLNHSYPNPFNPSTTISYLIPEMARVKIEIFNLLGQKITTLIDKEEPTGSYKLSWNAVDLSSGIYFCKMKANGKRSFDETQKLVLTK